MARGGTGKTTLSTNLTHYLAGEGYEVVLTDLDVEEPNSGLFLSGETVQASREVRMVPRWDKQACTFCGACQATCRFHAIVKLPTEVMIFPEMCHSCHACSELCPAHALPMVETEIGTLTHMRSTAFDFIESRLDIGEEQSVPLIRRTIDYVGEHFNPNIIRIFDAPPGTACPVIEVAKRMDLILLVTEPTPFGLHDLSLAVETMRHVGVPFGVVINRYGIGDDGVEEYCRREGIGIIARIPNDRRIAERYSSGELAYPGHAGMQEALAKVRDRILGVEVRV